MSIKDLLDLSRLHTSAVPPKEPVETTTVYTTFYDLIEVLQRHSGPDEDHVVVAMVMHLLDSGRVTLLRERVECLAWDEPGCR